MSGLLERLRDALAERRSHKRLARLEERQGNRAQAAAHLRSFTSLWKDADAALQPQVARARAAQRESP